MAEQNHENPKSKSFDTFRDEDPKKSKRKRFHSKHDPKTKQQLLECRTPPLPTGISSIEELIKQRENLQQELNSYNDETRKNFIPINSNKKNCDGSKTSKKRTNQFLDSKDNFGSKDKQPKSLEDTPPRYDDNSEDEENIIEIRRKRRKQLIEKLKFTHEEDQAEKKLQHTNSNQKHVHHDNISNKSQVTDIKMGVKEATDMFAEIDDFTPKSLPDGVSKDNNNDNPQLIDNWDDAEGYYNIRIGDVLNNRYTVKDILGKGVFANVVKAQDNNKPNTKVAIKITRNNELMHKTAIKEISYLKAVNEIDLDDKYHCIQFLGSFTHKGHLCLILEPLHMDMRCVIKKYCRHGVNLKALISYSRQLLSALRHLKKVGIIHADIKPDNMLVNEKKNILKLCDFGSAGKANENEPTPYLVSRFYRAPEIILGMTYSHGVDLWSAACTIYEMAVGKIMFTGGSNNKMLKCFMDVKGRIPNRLIKRGKFKDQHFNYNNNFLLHKKDEVTGRDKVVELVNIKVTRDLAKELKKSISNERKLTQLKELLDRMLMLDPAQRISISDALKHDFIQELEKSYE